MQRMDRWWAPALVLTLVFSLAACDGGDDDDDFGGVTPPPTSRHCLGSAAVPTAGVGVLDTGEAAAQPQPTGATVQPQAVATGTTLTLDDRSAPVALDPDGRFEIRDVTDGNHSLFVHHPDGSVTEIPFRMLEGRSLSLGTVQVRDGAFQHTGFNGFHFGFVDANNDGINDLFVDADGDGICDNAGLYAGYPYFMAHGWADANGDGINDRFRDVDGDGINDCRRRSGRPGLRLRRQRRRRHRRRHRHALPPPLRLCRRGTATASTTASAMPTATA